MLQTLASQCSDSICACIRRNTRRLHPVRYSKYHSSVQGARSWDANISWCDDIRLHVSYLTITMTTDVMGKATLRYPCICIKLDRRRETPGRKTPPPHHTHTHTHTHTHMLCGNICFILKLSSVPWSLSTTSSCHDPWCKYSFCHKLQTHEVQAEC
jgi:hypothetical protein